MDTTSRARRHFYAVVKRDIGIELGDSPEADEWQISTMGCIGSDGSDDCRGKSLKSCALLPPCRYPLS